MEGLGIQGKGSSKAILLGEFDAESFKEACELATVHHRIYDYDKERNTVWGCKLFDNEQDAKKNCLITKRLLAER